jgi:surfactin synthase thioesterase subunit/acyl carrier protein
MSHEARLLNCFRRVFPALSDDGIRQASMRRLAAWDSAALLGLIARVEGEFDVRFDNDQVNTLTSFDAILTVLQTITSGPPSAARSSDRPADQLEGDERVETPWLIAGPHRSEVRLRVLCFPHAGSSGATFSSWAAQLPPEIDICGVELPGRGSRRAERPLVRMRALIAAAVSGLAPAMEKPFAIFGHSLGALIAFELVRQLARQGGPQPLGLFVAGCRAPSLPAARPPIYASTEDELVHELDALNGTSPEILGNPEFRRIFLPALRADLEIGDTYAYRSGPALSCPVFAYGGLDDADARPDELKEWAREVERPLTTRFYPGDHFFLRTSEEVFLSALAQDLTSVSGVAHGA